MVKFTLVRKSESNLKGFSHEKNSLCKFVFNGFPVE